MMAGRRSKPRAPDTEIERRVNDVYKMLLNGIADREIVQYAAQNWDIKERQAKEYIARANDQFKAHAAIVQEAALGKNIARLERMYAKAIADGNHKLALGILQELNKLLGLYAPTLTEVSGKGGNPLRIEVAWTDGNPDEDRE